MTDFLSGTAKAMSEAMARGDISAVELLTLHFDRVDMVNPAINAVIWQDRDAALTQARVCDEERSAGTLRGPLHGIPITVKESFDLAGSPTTRGIPEWSDNVPQVDSDSVQRYRAAGGIIYGKTNVPFKLVDWQSFNAIHGTPSNPWAHPRTPGGSSGDAEGRTHE